jgi:hypothetical protein
VIQFVRFGRIGDEYSELMMLFIVVVFLSLDVFYFIWAIQAKTKFRDDISQYITQAMFGFASKMKGSLVENISYIK